MSIKIDQAFVSTVLEGGLALDIVHENGLYSTWGTDYYAHHTGVYTPSAQRGFVEIRNFPADVSAQSLADSDSHVGIFQGIIKYPDDTGAIAVKEKAELFLSLFQIGGSIEYSSQKVYIQSKSRDGGRVESGFYQVVCRINYQAFVAR